MSLSRFFLRRPGAARAVPGALWAFFALLALCAFTACEERADRRAAPPSEAGPVSARWARGLSWESRGARLEVTVSEPWKGARQPLRYSLVPQNEAAGNPEPGVEEIRLPVRRIACLASVHIGFLKALGATGTIVAVDAANHVYDSAVRAGVASGRVFVAGSGTQLNVERLLQERPDLVLANAVGVSEYEAMERLRRAGIPVLVTAEWMEHHPLARAEWLRLFGLLLGRERAADSLFTRIESSYVAQARAARAQARKPTVLIGGPFRDQWFVPGGRSYMARFLRDAGADYLWKDDTTAGGVPLSFETVLTQARDAEAWLYPGDFNHHWRDLSDGRRQDARFASFSAFRNARVYNHDARRLPDGANDYWESGLVNPHRMLADLVSIFHGGGDCLFYHRRLPGEGKVR
jgi:iron complex transport system substrate-binding protein